VGVQFTASGATFTNSGEVQGGSGGAGGPASRSSHSGEGGSGGAGIVGSGISIANSGTIEGGLYGNGSTRADAILFTGGANTLIIEVDGSGSVTFNQSTAQTLGNEITGSGSVLQDGAGMLVLTGFNTYAGATTISSGTLAVAGNFGSIGNSASVTLANSGATLDLSAVHSTSGGIIQNLSGVSGTTVNLGSTGFIKVNLSTSTTFAGVIQGTGNEDLSTSALMLNGNGNTLTLDGANTYTDGTFVIGGTLAIGPGGSVASSGEVSLLGAGATLDISGGGNQTVKNLTGNPGTLVTLGSNTLTDDATVCCSEFFGAIQGTGGLNVTGPGVLDLGGSNT